MALQKNAFPRTGNYSYDPRQFIVEERDGEIILHKVGRGLQKLYLEPTARCNLECVTCVRRQWPEHAAEEMDMALFRELLRQMKAFPALEWIHLGGFGEPLAHTRAGEIIESLCKAGFRVSMNTNGTLLTPELAETLIMAGVQKIYFSIDGVDEELFGKIRVGGKLPLVIGNIKTLQRLKRKQKVYHPKVGLEFVLMRDNIHQLPLLPDLARELGAQVVLLTNLLAHSPEMYRRVLYDNPEAGRDLGAGVLGPPPWNNDALPARLPEPAVWPAPEQDWVLWGTMSFPRMYWGSGRRCGFIESNAAAIRRDGAVSPCYGLMYAHSYYLDRRRKNVTPYLPGNVRESSLAEIWNDPGYVKFRHRVRGYHFPSCMDCTARETCEYASRNEDCWGNTPSCADCLWSQGIVRCP